MNVKSVAALLTTGLITLSSAHAQGNLSAFTQGKLSSKTERQIEAFARDPAFGNVRVSPDGKSIIAIQRTEKDSSPLLFVYQTNNLKKKPVVLAADPMEIVSARWLNDERILVRLSQDVENLERATGFTRRASRLASISKRGGDWTPLPKANADRRSRRARLIENLQPSSLFSSLPTDPEHVLLSIDSGQGGPSDIYKVNVETGARQLVYRGTRETSPEVADLQGNVRIRAGLNGSGDAVVLEGRAVDGPFKEIGRISTKSDRNIVAQILEPIGFYNTADPNEIWVISNHEADKAGVYAFDIKTGQFKELLFRHPLYDATGVSVRYPTPTTFEVVGFTYSGPANPTAFYTDPTEEAFRKGIEGVLPDDGHVSIESTSRDNKVRTVAIDHGDTGPVYYLYQENKPLTPLGVRYPELQPEDVSPRKWVTYKARDGLTIPSILTIPDGRGPFPAVVLPHGGPIARDNLGFFDFWAQFLASQGYVVLQPQFRISTGFGTKHLAAGFAQWGKDMQDDLDDGAAWLVSQGLTKRENLAIFGWSYGGYAAFVGSARDPNPWRCAIAGAGVSDIDLFQAEVAENGTLAQQGFVKTLQGLDPLDMVDSVDIPILVIHGDLDERVPIAESEKFVARLRRFDKPHRYVVLEGANHFFGTIYYENYLEMFSEMINWLDNRCQMKEGL